MTGDDLRASYDKVAAEYAKHFVAELDGKPLDRALLAVFADEVRGQGPVLDVGCGPGHLAAHLAALGVDAGGLDLSPGMVEVARAAFPNLRFEVGDLLALGDRRLAGIAAFYALCHLPPEMLPRAAASLAGALAPGGCLLVSFHIGDETVHLADWWGHAVAVDFWFHPFESVVAALTGAGLALESTLQRSPYPTEHPTQRGYVMARRP